MSNSSKITIFLKDKQKHIEVEEGQSAKDLALSLNLHGPDQALAAEINGNLVDLLSPLQEGDTLRFIDFSQKEGREIFWHSSAHILAQAILRLFPNALATIGPCIEEGFYYDFANLSISDEDFALIESEVKKIVKENFQTKRVEFSKKEEALKAFSSNPYKVEMIEEMDEQSCISAYQQGEFFDLCRGPHLPNLGKVKAFKVLKTSGAYWRGDSQNEMLTRIYAISYPEKSALKDYLHRLEEAKKRDHKILGPRLGLFSLHEEAPGMPFFHPRGMTVWQALLNYWSEIHQREGYQEIKTPIILSRKLWETSGHWENYQENMYTCSIDDADFAIKPMNCPGCMLYYKCDTVSYRKLPLKIAEIGNVHRHEPSGAVGGLMRVRCFHQDDAHVFLEPFQIEDEVLKIIQLADELYSTFDLHYHLELSTRPEKNTIGSDEDWQISTEALRKALDRSGKDYRINEGDGAFYGPKIDFHIKDAIGRTWQCGTIQLDMALPERFELEYTASDGSRKRPVMLHRALYGSIERFLGILIEHFSGRLPLWLSPRQICILTVADRHLKRAEEIAETLQEKGFICDIDQSAQSLSKKVRTAQILQYNYMLTVGDQELETSSLSLRTRENIVFGSLSIEDFLTKIQEEKKNRHVRSPFVQAEKPCLKLSQ